jgi:hypothetical protein
MPHSKGLFLTMLWMSRLSRLSLVSSLIRTPSACNKVPRHNRIDRSYQVKRAAAVTCFIGLISSIAGLVRTTGERPREFEARSFVIVHEVVVADCDVRSAHDQNSLKQGVLHRESGDGHIVKAGMIETIHKNAVR